MLKQTFTRQVFDTALFAKIQGLDLEQIKLYFLKRHNWSLEKVENAISGYHQFLYLVEKVGHISPSKEIDDIWHRHILHTKQYAEDCHEIFGRFIHHNPFPISGTSEKNLGCGDDDCVPVECCEGGKVAENQPTQFTDIVFQHFGKEWFPIEL